jgi:hypothetical protein
LSVKNRYFRRRDNIKTPPKIIKPSKEEGSGIGLGGGLSGGGLSGGGLSGGGLSGGGLSGGGLSGGGLSGGGLSGGGLSGGGLSGGGLSGGGLSGGGLSEKQPNNRQRTRTSTKPPIIGIKTGEAETGSSGVSPPAGIRTGEEGTSISPPKGIERGGDGEKGIAPLMSHDSPEDCLVSKLVSGDLFRFRAKAGRVATNKARNVKICRDLVAVFNLAV